MSRPRAEYEGAASGETRRLKPRVFVRQENRRRRQGRTLLVRFNQPFAARGPKVGAHVKARGSKSASGPVVELPGWCSGEHWACGE